MKELESDHSVVPAPEWTLQYQFSQLSYLNSHLQIADAKGAALVAYCAVLTGYTASRLSAIEPRNHGFGYGLAFLGGAVAIFAIASAFAALAPRFWSGWDSRDSYSWVGLAEAANARPYHDRIRSMDLVDMRTSMADTAETTAQVVRRKYWLISVGIFAAMLSTGLQAASWFLLKS